MAGCPNPFAQTALSQLLIEADVFLPKMIIMWNDSIGSIPEGWQFCDGSNGTPDLRGLFVRATGFGLNLGNTGGSEGHDHLFTSDSHTHLDVPGTELRSLEPKTTDLSEEEVSGRTDNTDNFPPFYALFYIMKL